MAFIIVYKHVFSLTVNATEGDFKAKKLKKMDPQPFCEDFLNLNYYILLKILNLS